MTYVDALQTALAAEHAAGFVIGYLGAQTSTSAEPALATDLREAYLEHRTRRDALEEQVRAANADPVAAAASYAVPDVAGVPERIRKQAVAVERACGNAYGFLVANSPPDRRRAAITALLDCARREMVLGGEPRHYPGR